MVKQGIPVISERKRGAGIERNDLIFNIVVALCLLLCAVFSRIKLFSYISLALYITYLVYILLRRRMFYVKYLSFAFSAVAPVVGAVVIELFPNIYLRELRCESHFSGSLPLMVLSYWVFLFVLLTYSPRGDTKRIIVKFDLMAMKPKSVLSLLTFLSAGMILVAFIYTVMHFPPAFILRIDNFQYAFRYKLPGFLSIFSSISYLLLVFPLLSLIFGSRAFKIGSLITLAVYLLYRFWTGGKFGPFFTLLWLMLLVFYRKIDALEQKKFWKIIWAVGLAMILLIILAVAIQAGRGSESMSQYFYQRTAQQGQLWWRIFDRYSDRPYPGEFINEMKAFISRRKPIRECVGEQHGIYRMMYLCAPRAVVDTKLLSGSEYTEAGYAASYYYFGVLGPIIYSVIMGVLISKIVNGCLFALDRRDYISALIYLRLIVITQSAYCMFIFSDYIEPLSLLSYLYLMVTAYFGRRGKLPVAVKI